MKRHELAVILGEMTPNERDTIEAVIFGNVALMEDAHRGVSRPLAAGLLVRNGDSETGFSYTGGPISEFFLCRLEVNYA